MNTDPIHARPQSPVSSRLAGPRARAWQLRRALRRRRYSQLPVLPEGWKGGVPHRARGAGLRRLLHPPRRLPHPKWLRVGPMVWIAAAVVPVAVVLVLAKTSGDADPSGWPRSEPAISRAGLRISPLPGWKATARTPSVPGLPLTDPIALEEPVSGMVLLVGLLPATAPALLPEELISRLQAPLGRPSTVKLKQGLEGYYHPRITVDGLAGPLDVYVFPTTSGILTAACLADGQDDGGAPYYDCGKNVATLALSEGRPLSLGADSAFRERLPATIAELDAARAVARRKLTSRVPAEQALSAAAVADAYDRAAATLRPLSPRSSIWAREIAAQLTAVGDAYRGVIAPLRRSDAAAYARGKADVRAQESRLERLVADAGAE
jgi:hypothetical protein